MKLLPRLYEPEAGRIMIDGYDLAKLQLDRFDDKLVLSHRIVCYLMAVFGIILPYSA